MLQRTPKFDERRFKYLEEQEEKLISAYKKTLLRRIKLLRYFTSAWLPVEGSFVYRLRARLLHRWNLEYKRSVAPFLDLFFMVDERYDTILWLFL